MTRKEQKLLKEKAEQEFIESIKGKKINSMQKSKFRNTNAWKEFRNRFKGRSDPISLKKLPKRFQLHHMSLDSRNYTDLRMEHFAALNGTTHDIVHYLYSIYRHDKNVLKRLKRILDKMVEINDGKDIKDFK